MSESSECPIRVNTSSHWIGGRVKGSSAVGLEPVTIKKEPVEREHECDGSTVSPLPRPPWSSSNLPLHSRFEKSNKHCDSHSNGNKPNTINEYDKNLSLNAVQPCYDNCETEKTINNSGQNTLKPPNLAENVYDTRNEKNLQDISKFPPKPLEVSCYGNNFSPNIPNSCLSGQNFSQKDAQTSFGQLFMQPFANDMQKTNNESFYSKYDLSGSRDLNYQGDIFGRNCGGYPTFLNHHHIENVEKDPGFFQYPNLHTNPTINLREPSVNEDIPGSSAKNLYPGFPNSQNEAGYNKNLEDRRNLPVNRRDSGSKYPEYAKSTKEHSLIGSITSSKSEHSSFNVQLSPGNSKRDSGSRAHVLASPGNSCIVSSTNTNGGMRNFGADEVTGSAGGSGKSEWNDKPASVSSSRQELVVSSSTRCDSSAPLPLPRTDIVSTTAPVTGHISNPSGSGTRRGALQLWQFLVALLDEPSSAGGCIAWTGRGLEFKLLEPEEVARRWGIQKNRPAMNYDKLSRSLRYYYEKGIMQKVAGERYVYKFVCDPDALFNMAYGPHHTSPESTNLHHAPPKTHQTSKPVSAADNPENLCLKQNSYHHASNINPTNNLPADTKPHQNFTHHHQNYDLFPGFYNTNHHHHLNYPPAHFSIHPSLQQYIATPGGHFVNSSAQIGGNFDGHHQEQNGFQHGDPAEANGAHNWNVSRYYHHQNQIGYDG